MIRFNRLPLLDEVLVGIGHERGLSLSPGFAVRPQPRCVAGFVSFAGRQIQNRLCGTLFTSYEIETVQFEKQHSDHESGALIAIDERTVADDASRIKCGQFHNGGGIGIDVMLTGTRQRRLQKPLISQSLGAAVSGEEAVMNRQDVAFFDPEWVFIFR